MTPVEFNFRHALATDIGRRRKRNEDMVLAMPEHGVFLTADGMGGGAAGDVASRAVCYYIRDAIITRSPSGPLALSDTVAVIRDATDRASKWIRTITPQLGARMVGTTLIAMAFDPERTGRAICLHAGDSRLYRYRRKRLELLTVDHSAANSLGVNNPEDLPPEVRGMITRAVGVREAVELEETELVVLPRDVFLLCTDGFYNMVSAPEATELFKAANDNLETLSSSMINAANQSGGFDNITVLLAQRILPPVPGEDAKETLKG